MQAACVSRGLIGVKASCRDGAWTPESSNAAPAQRGPGQRVVPVEIAKAISRPVPVRIDSLGTVTPIASVAIKARLETTIVDVHFQDGARVSKSYNFV